MTHLRRPASHIWVLFSVMFMAAAALLRGAVPAISQADAPPPGALAYQTTLQERRLLVLRSADGTATRSIALPDGIGGAPAHALAPNGLGLAFYTGAVSLPDQAAADDLTLNVLRLPEGEIVEVAHLLPPNFPQNIQRNADLLIARDSTLADPDFTESVWLAFAGSLQNNYAWSPDGRYLAFSGAMEGPSTDLYLYDMETQRVERLTDGIEQVYGIRWSPDGRWVWHNTISYSYCQTCGGHNYAAAADGSQVRTLPGDEVDRFLTWIGPATFLETDQANGPGDYELRRIDIDTGSVTVLWPGVHEAFAYDAQANRLAVIGSTRPRPWPPEENFYLADLTTGDVQQVPEEVTGGRVDSLLDALRFRNTASCTSLPGIVIKPCEYERHPSRTSPDGSYRVAENLDLLDASGTLVQPAPADISPTGSTVYWHTAPDRGGEGYYIVAGGNIYYQSLAQALSGAAPTVIERGVRNVTWLPAADVAALPAPGAPSAEQPSTPVTVPVLPPMLSDDPQAALALEQRIEMARRLAELALAANERPGEVANGLALLLAREAVWATWRTDSLNSNLIAQPFVLPEAENALRATVASAYPFLGMVPATGPTGRAQAAAFSPDNTLLATGHANGAIYLRERATGRVQASLTGHTSWVGDLAFARDGAKLASAGGDAVRIWDVQRRALLHTFSGLSPYINSVEWNPNGTRLLVRTSNYVAQLWDADHGNVLMTLPIPVDFATLSPDGTRIAAILHPELKPEEYRDPSSRSFPYPPPAQVVQIFDLGGMEVLRLAHTPENKPPGGVRLARYSPNGAYILTGDGDSRVHIWDASGALIRSFDVGFVPEDIAFDPTDESDLPRIVVHSDVVKAAIFDPKTGQQLAEYSVYPMAGDRISFSPDGEWLVSGNGADLPMILDLATGTRPPQFDLPEADHVVAHPTQPLYAVAAHPAIQLRDLHSGEIVRRFAGHTFFAINALAIDPTGRWIASGDSGGVLRVWRLADGALQFTVQSAGGFVSDLAFSHDGLRIVVVGGLPDHFARVWNVPSGAPAAAAEFDNGISAVDVRADGLVALAVYNRVDLVRLDTLERVRSLEGHQYSLPDVSFSADGSLLATTSSDGRVHIWNPDADGDPLRTLDLRGSDPSALAFSHDGRLLATGGSISVRPTTLWDVATGEQVAAIGQAANSWGSLQGTYALAFSHDGRTLLTSDGDSMTRRWDVSRWTAPDEAVPFDAQTASIDALLERANAIIPRPILNSTSPDFSGEERLRYGLDAFIGPYGVTASTQPAYRSRRAVISLVIRPADSSGSAPTLLALTNDRLLLASQNEGVSWQVAARAPLTLTLNGLGIPARADDPILVTAREGLFRVTEGGSFALVHDREFLGVTASRTQPGEWWGVTNNKVFRSMDGGQTWGEASNDLSAYSLQGPLMMAPPGNNPQFVLGFNLAPYDPALWRGTGNGFWKRLPAPTLLNNPFGYRLSLAWDDGNSTLYLGDVRRYLYRSRNAAEPNENAVTWEIAEDFGDGTRVVPLAIGQGGALYLSAYTNTSTRLLRGTWDGAGWTWQEIDLP